MQKRQITMEDGRYLIFYTFEDEPAAAASRNLDKEDGASTERPSGAKPVAEEERRV